MNQFKKILFYADGAKGEKQALESCLLLAVQNNAALAVMDVVTEVSTNDPQLEKAMKRLQNVVVKERKTALQRMLGELDTSGLKRAVKIIVKPGKRHIEVIRSIKNRGVDLLVKSANHQSKLEATLFGGTDLNLMRSCPCPVWIIKPGRKQIKRVLATLDMAAVSAAGAPEARQLAEQILAISSDVAARAGAELHVLNAWHPGYEPHLRGAMAKAEYSRTMRILKETTATRLHELVIQHVRGEATEHLLKGDAEKVISKFATDNKIDLLVMGTLSRTGIPGLLIGNTAESVLRHVNCSVLTLKPATFVTPVL